ncbi:hypothetical protein B7P43_G18273 [Cryptotermes secundus]|uniref:Reverse transcriptase domain-containing protein n=1 Tax=Cryptotermes secundus TaxID=105785 RepID=A0A2J7Q3S2_9NEOP|nr:hypothetical protein B7P43_G18273 [Cryptotermes secundus]
MQNFSTVRQVVHSVPSNLIRLIAATLHNTKAKVKINGDLSEGFQISCGVKQGHPLSASLFILVIDEIIKSLDVRGNISTRLKQCCAYTDVIFIIARTKQTLINTFEELKKPFGPSRNADGSWRIKTNDKLDNLIKGRNTVNFIKAQRISWLGHFSSMEAGQTVKIIHVWQAHAIRKRGKPKVR